LLENVDRILWSPSKQYGRDFSIILRCLYEKGYSVEWRIINAAEYGQAQRRRRTFIFAYHNQTQVFQELAEKVCVHGIKSMHEYVTQSGVLAKAFPLKDHARVYTDNWIDEISYLDVGAVSKEQRVKLYNAGVMMNGRIYSVDVTPVYERSMALRSVLEQGDIDSHFFLRDADMPKWIYAKGAKKESRRRKDGSEYCFSEGAVEFPECLDKPARTMLTSESAVGRSSHVVKDIKTGRLRTLTPLECERLNGFPDDWTNTDMPEKMRYFCMGNALVVPLVERIGQQIAKLN
jgi:DNA (cytosine-5)-methyltransferase 1